ncbi:MAG: hypothetical protein RKO24_15880 [Candidatus Competibacter sp.]|nr:hypothetical protein [Candidatus Competibacter sp.]
MPRQTMRPRSGATGEINFKVVYKKDKTLSEAIKRLSKNLELIFKQNSLGARASSPLEKPKAGWKPAHPAKKSNS